MPQFEPTKRCRKRIEGYSEIVVRQPQSDSLSDIFRTESNCINCKCLIPSMIIITIGAALIGSFLLIELQATTSYLQQFIEITESNSTNETAQLNGTSIFNTLEHTDATEIVNLPSHRRTKRNSGNETGSSEINYNSKLGKYYDNFHQKYDDFKSATDKLFTELQNYWPTLFKNRNSSYRSPELILKSEDDKSLLRNEPSSFSATSQVNRSRRYPEPDVTKNEQNFISFTQSETSVDKEHVEANVTERISSTPDQVNATTGVASGGTNHTERQVDLNTIEGTNATMPNTGTSPTSTELENHLKNDSLNHDVMSSTKITVTRRSDNINADGDEGSTNNGISTSSINDIEYSYSTTRDEPLHIQQQNPTQLDKSELHQNSTEQNESYTTEIPLSPSIPPNEPDSSISNPAPLDKSAIDQNSTNHNESYTMQVPLSPSTPPTETSSSISDQFDATTHRNNIMKIPPRSISSSTETTTIDDPPAMQTTTEDFPISTFDDNTPNIDEDPSTSESPISRDTKLEVVEKKEKLDILYKKLLQINRINKTESVTYLLKNISANALFNDIMKLITERLNQSRYYRHTSSSDTEWNMLCYQKVIKKDGKFDMKFVKVPLNQSEIEKIPILTHRYGADDWPLYSAHSLDTHKLYQEIPLKNQTAENAIDQIKEVVMFPSEDTSTSTEDAKGSKYYCIYSQSRDAQETKQSLEERIKLLLMTNDKFWNEIENQLCAGDEKMCLNGKQCIKAVLWCDQIIHCEDRSDETNCSCRDLINEDKLCDGYFDCPKGEDEEECFGCSKNEFSCNDFPRGQKDKVLVTCIPMEERCDGIPHCPNNKDEKDCELLADKIHHNDTIVVSYLQGYLHRNWKGKWYPVCNEGHKKLAVRACESELGIQNIRGVEAELMQITFNYYNGEFVAVEDNGEYNIVNQCDPINTYIYVKCPSEYCGSRMNLESIQKYKYKREVTNKTEEKERIIEILKELMFKAELNPESQIRNRRWDSDEPRVVGGEVSKPGAWPWITAIYRNGIFHCGAMILDDTWLLSAAHCVEKYPEYYYEAQAGILRRFSFSPMQQIRKVTHVIRHELYDHIDMRNDIALLRVDPPLKLNRWIQPTCLPEARPPWGPPPGAFCTAVGWGATREHGSDPDNMMEVQVPILPVCKHRPDIEGHEICAGYAEGLRDTCQGDSGGPLLCRIPSTSQDRWYVSGIVSHGEGCARRMEPGVYTRIAIHLGWILENIKIFSESQRFWRSVQPKLECPGMKCSEEGQCIAERRICDKVIDCLQGEDELNSICQKEWSGRSNSKDIVGIHSPIHTNRSVGNSIHPENGSEFHNWRHTELHSLNIEATFVCKIINQTIPEQWYCDDEMDCEDGTDEINCLCGDILKKNHSSLICNGIPDCYDWSDEKNCAKENCTKDEFMCYRSYTCVNRTSICDGKSDCPGGEDEQHCYALVERTSVTLDNFNIPAYKESGTLMQNENGTWKPYCVSKKSDELNEEMHKICNKLGFKTKQDTKIELRELLDYPCTLIRLDCLNYKEDTSILPWFANIYVNGTKKCNGLLLTDQWLVADYSCPNYNLQEDHVVAVLGGKRGIGDRIQSLYEQIIRVDYVFYHDKQGAIMMHFENPANTSEHVKPLRTEKLETTVFSTLKNTECFMIADLKDPAVISIIPEDDCWGNDDCPYRPSNKIQFCGIYNQNYTLSSLICLATRGFWRLTAFTNKKFDKFCLTNATTFSMKPWNDPLIMKNDFKPFPVLKCSGHRCSLGKCISPLELCDGKSDCRNNEDETPEKCLNTCKAHSFKCKNNQCIDLNLICDGNDNCGDRSDEPSECSHFSCATYLNMTKPWKLCDSHVDCWDKSDENSVICPFQCNSTSHFKCTSSNECVPKEFVCDGESDCPQGEDESKCQKFDHTEKDVEKPNLLQQSRGKWHNACWKSDLIGFSPNIICKESNLDWKNHQVKLIPGPEIRTNEYTIIVLRNKKEFKLSAKPLLQPNMTDTCYHVHLKCQ